MPGCLTVVHCPDPALARRVIELGTQSLVFGRDAASAELVIADRSLSRSHARLSWDPVARALRITDTASRNGCFVASKRVESALVAHADVIRLGDTLLVYQEERPMVRTEAALAALAQGSAPVLVSGETGTGKRWLVERLHALSGRLGELVHVRCAELAHGELAGMLFGDARSGGQRPRARAGTLFLEEIGDASEALQAALVCLLDEQRGAQAGSPGADAPRLVASSQLDLAGAVVQRRFRADLLDALTELELPPLRERRDELLELAQGLARADGYTLRLTTDAAEALLTYDFPFNLRELRTLLRAFFALRGPRTELDVGYLAERHPEVAEPALRRRQGSTTGVPSSAPTRPLVPTLGGPAQDRGRLASLLDQYAGDVGAVARALGKPRTQVQRWVDALGLGRR
jgi:DNA-binding NtrC family response regulator